MTTYYGNQVAYGSGGWFRAVIDVWDAGGNTGTSTTVYYQYSVQFGASVSDSNNQVNWSDPWGSGSANNFGFSFGAGGGQVTVSGPHSNAAGIQYGGGNTLSFTMSVANIAGVTGTSTANATYGLPARTPSPPNPPSIAVADITATGARPYTTVAGAENGATTQVLNYRVQRASDGASMGDKQAGYGGIAWTNLTRATGYVAFAQAYNSAGWGGWSAGVGFNTLQTVPNAPTGLAVSNVSSDDATAAWTAPSDNGGSAITSSTVQVATDAAFTTGVLNFSTGALTGLQPATTYYVRVRSANGVGAGAWSAVVTFETLSGAYVKVDGVWKKAKIYVKVNGVWKPAKIYKKISGVWKL